MRRSQRSKPVEGFYDELFGDDSESDCSDCSEDVPDDPIDRYA